MRARFLLELPAVPATFADDDEPTPRWDYNQVPYRLGLDDGRLAGARAPKP